VRVYIEFGGGALACTCVEWSNPMLILSSVIRGTKLWARDQHQI